MASLPAESRPFDNVELRGIWENSDVLPRCCLLTTAANAMLEPIHDRMPVIVPHEDWDEWFSPGELAAESFLRITTPYEAEEMSALPVSPLVNSARVDDPYGAVRPGSRRQSPTPPFP